MAWNTDIYDWLPFPWSCDNMYKDNQTELPEFYSGSEVTSEGLPDIEVAFNCKHFPSYRILTTECLGMDCPDCKIHNHDKFIENLKDLPRRPPRQSYYPLPWGPPELPSFSF